MSSPGQPMPPQAAAPAQPQAAPVQGQAPNPQAIMAAVQKGLVECVQGLSQELNVPPPVILQAVKAIIANLGGNGPPQPSPAAAGVRPTQ